LLKAAAEPGAGQPQMVAQHIEQRHVVMRNGNADVAAIE
jgi:hypothetical protein